MLFKVSSKPPTKWGRGAPSFRQNNDLCSSVMLTFAMRLEKKSAITRSSIGEHSCVKSTSYTWYQNLSRVLIHFVLKTFNTNYLNDNKTNNRLIFLPGNANSITNYKSNFTVTGKILLKKHLDKKKQHIDYR